VAGRAGSVPGLQARPGDAVQVANIAAGIVVGKWAQLPVEKYELLAALAPEIALSAEDKVVTRPELVTRVALWKANGERVGRSLTAAFEPVAHRPHHDPGAGAPFRRPAYCGHQQRRIREWIEGAWPSHRGRT